MKSEKVIAAILAVSCICMGIAGCKSTPQTDTGSAQTEVMQKSDTFKPSDIAMTVMEKYDYPYMGLSFKLPKTLADKMDNQSVAMLSDEVLKKDNTDSYAVLTWSRMSEEQKNAEIKAKGTGFEEWEKELFRIGTLGMYNSEISEQQLDSITRCDTHTKLGDSSDGKYKYYLSTNSKADKEEIKDINAIEVKIKDKEKMNEGESVFTNASDIRDGSAGDTISPLSTETIDGTAFTEKDFADYDLTMVNIFATWCNPCVNEIPDLQRLYKDMQPKGVNIIGVVYDAVNMTQDSYNESDNDEAIELAKQIREKTKAEYPFIKPDTTGLNGVLGSVYAFPQTIFVDKNGNIVGETYTGSRSYDEWAEIIQKELDNVKKSDK